MKKKTFPFILELSELMTLTGRTEKNNSKFSSENDILKSLELS